jgi:hypothetical protein
MVLRFEVFKIVALGCRDKFKMERLWFLTIEAIRPPGRSAGELATDERLDYTQTPIIDFGERGYLNSAPSSKFKKTLEPKGL